MRLMTGITSKTARVVGRNDLRKRLRLCGIRLVAADAQHSRIELGRSHRGWIVRVLGLRPVAGFAIHMRVLAIFLLIEHVCMAAFAGVMAGIINGPRGNFRERVPAVVPVFAETLRYQKSPDNQKEEHAGGEYARQTEKMSCISEDIHTKLSAPDCRVAV